LECDYYKRPEEVKKQAYLALVRPHFEYASSAWDLHLQKQIQQIEMVQSRAARFIKSNYSRDPGTVTTLLEQLELPPTIFLLILDFTIFLFFIFTFIPFLLHDHDLSLGL
jgi:hypothetical protein